MEKRLIQKANYGQKTTKSYKCHDCTEDNAEANVLPNFFRSTFPVTIAQKVRITWTAVQYTYENDQKLKTGVSVV